jgi:predicted MFS family arabinose efflux permease
MSEASGTANMVRALNDRVYGPYAFGHIVSAIGIWVQRLGIAWMTWEMTESGTWLGAMAFANMFPLAVLSPLAGAASDRWGALRLVRFSNWMTALQSVLMLILMWTGAVTIWWMLILTVFLGVMMAINQPARLAIVPTLVAREHVPAAVAIGSMSYNSAQFIGPAIAGFLIPWVGVESTCIVQLVTYVAFGIVLIWTKPREARSGKPKSAGLLIDLRDGFSYSWNHAGIMPLMLLLTIIALGIRPVADLFPAFADIVFGRGAEGLTTLTASIGVGSVCGVMWVARQLDTRGMVKKLLVFGVFTALSGIVFAVTGNFWVAAAAAFGIGATMTPIAIGTQTMMQTGIDPAMRGRVMALYVALWRSVPSIGAFLMGYASDYVGLHWPVLGGVLLVAITWLWVTARRKEIAAAIEPPPDEQLPSEEKAA